jgi:transposase
VEINIVDALLGNFGSKEDEMSAHKFTDEFKRDAVAQVEDRGYAVREVAERLGVSTKSIYTWQKQFSRPTKVIQEVDAQADEIRRLKRDLLRVTEERDILKKATVGSTGQRNGSFEGNSRRLEAKRFSWPRIEPKGDLIKVMLSING